jgi:hypothetical protein
VVRVSLVQSVKNGVARKHFALGSPQCRSQERKNGYAFEKELELESYDCMLAAQLVGRMTAQSDCLTSALLPAAHVQRKAGGEFANSFE